MKKRDKYTIMSEFDHALDEDGIGLENITSEHLITLRDWSEETFEGQISRNNARILFAVAIFQAKKIEDF